MFSCFLFSGTKMNLVLFIVVVNTKKEDNKLMHESFFPIIQPTDMISKLQNSVSLR